MGVDTGDAFGAGAGGERLGLARCGGVTGGR